MKTVPNVTGMNIETAVKVLTGAGFKTPSIKYVESEEERDTVVEQLPEANTEWDITKTIELKISEGPEPTTEPTTEPTQPAEVTKDVVIDLKGEADSEDVHVSVVRDGVEIYNQTVPMGTKNITLSGQTGTGTVSYSIVVNHSDGWETSVVFTN
jgi:beta-lactam-binding protein with PASTA domain